MQKWSEFIVSIRVTIGKAGSKIVTVDFDLRYKIVSSPVLKEVNKNTWAKES